MILTGIYLAAKIPFLLYDGPINPDESQILGQVITLSYDPVFWRSVDGTTSGPLNSYLLWFLGKTFFTYNYLLLHWLAAGLVLFTLWLIYRTLLLLVNYRAALSSVLITYGFFLFNNHKDFNHYNSELVSVVLLTVGFYILVRIKRLAHPSLWLYGALGAVCCLVPLAKLQGGPLAFLYLLYTCLSLLYLPLPKNRKIAALGSLVGGAGAILLSLVIWLVSHNLLEEAYIMYISTNLSYYNTGNGLRLFLKLVFGSSYDYLFFLVLSGTVWLFAGLTFLQNRTRSLSPSLFTCFLGLNLIFSFWVIGKTGYVFEHYLFYTLIPISILNGYAIQQLFAQRSTRAFYLSYKSLLLMVLVGQVGNSWIKSERPSQQFAPIEVSKQEKMVISLIKYYSRPTDCLAVWGWNCLYYTKTRLWQATRQNHSIRCMKTRSLGALHNVSLINYYRRQFLDDLKQNRPAVFVDEVGANSMFDEPGELAHERIPALKSFIEKNYQLVSEEGGISVYVRLDRL